MKPTVTILITFLLFLLCTTLAAQENPFMEMAGKPYRLYYEDLNRQLVDIDSTTPEEAARIADQMRAAARQSGGKRWLLEADYFLQLHRLSHALYLHRQRGDLEAHQAAEGEAAITALLPLLERAEKIGAIDLQTRIADRIMEISFVRTLNYEMGFRYALVVEELLSQVSVADFPTRPAAYLALERWYNRFGEYEKAERICYKAIEDPAADFISWNALVHALNDLGCISRDYRHDLNRSDSCFLRILATAPPDTTGQHARSERLLWSYIATAQLGTNASLRDDYDRAIPQLAYAVECIPAHNPYNYSFTAGKAILLADIYIKRHQLPEAKRYLDSAYLYIERAPEAAQWHAYYPVLARYYGARGETGLALAYMDSVLNTRSRYEEDFNLRKLHLAEQRAQQDELALEKLRRETYQRYSIILLVFACVVIALSALLLYSYRQKRAAYRVLVRRIQQWAAQASPLPLPPSAADRDVADVIDADYVEIPPDPVVPPHETNPADTTGRASFERLEQLFQSEKLFRHPELSLEYAAERLGLNRSQLSHIVNHHTGRNFNVYVNEYRVKEAVRLMSSPDAAHLSLEGIAFESGFNHRKTFYQAFKKLTGLSPSAFRENLHKG